MWHGDSESVLLCPDRDGHRQTRVETLVLTPCWRPVTHKQQTLSSAWIFASRRCCETAVDQTFGLKAGSSSQTRQPPPCDDVKECVNDAAHRRHFPEAMRDFGLYLIMSTQVVCLKWSKCKTFFDFTWRWPVVVEIGPAGCIFGTESAADHVFIIICSQKQNRWDWLHTHSGGWTFMKFYNVRDYWRAIFKQVWNSLKKLSCKHVFIIKLLVDNMKTAVCFVEISRHTIRLCWGSLHFY